MRVAWGRQESGQDRFLVRFSALRMEENRLTAGAPVESRQVRLLAKRGLRADAPAGGLKANNTLHFQDHSGSKSRLGSCKWKFLGRKIFQRRSCGPSKKF